jgi:hypothetical protein
MQRQNGKKSRSRNRQPKKQNDKYDGSLSISNNLQKIPRQVGLILPDRYRTNLRYWKSVSFDLTAVFSAGVRFRPSAAYDVDPLLATTAMSGFSELALLYGSYRVLSSRIRVESVNTSNANPRTLIVCPVNIDPGAAPTTAYVLASKEQPYSKAKMSGLSGSPQTIVSNVMSTEKMYGSKSVLFDDNFSSVSNSTPNNNWYWFVSTYSNILDPSLVWAQITIDVDVEFFDRSFLPT